MATTSSLKAKQHKSMADLECVYYSVNKWCSHLYDTSYESLCLETCVSDFLFMSKNGLCNTNRNTFGILLVSFFVYIKLNKI